MSYDPNDPNGDVQTMLAAGCIVAVIAVVGLLFGAVQLVKWLL